MSLAVALRLGFLTTRLGSRSMPSLCLYLCTYLALSSGVVAQDGYSADSCLILSPFGVAREGSDRLHVS